MNNNFREGLNALREISDPELIKLALEKITGKKLVDYEGVNALVAALMGYYNEELKNKEKIANNLTTTQAGYVLDGRQGKVLDGKKFDKAGGTISGNTTMQQNLVVNGSTSTNSLILNGWTITIR